MHQTVEALSQQGLLGTILFIYLFFFKFGMLWKYQQSTLCHSVLAGSYKIYTVYNIMSTITFTIYQLSVTVTAADRGRLTALHDWWQWLFSSCRGKLSVNHRYPLISTISIEALINTGYAYLWQIASTMALLHSSEVQPHVCCHPLMTHVKPYAKSYLFWTMFLYFICPQQTAPKWNK